MKKKAIIIFLIILCLIILKFFVIDKVSGITVSLGYINININQMESIIQYGEHSVIGAHYPVFDGSNINNDILKLINKNITKFKDTFNKIAILDSIYKSELNIDYEIFRPTDDIVSIKFTILENMYYYAYPKIYVETINYDLRKDKRIYLNNIFHGNYLEELCTYANNDFNNKDSFSNFVLYTDSILFINNKNDSFIKIPYIMLKDYIRPNFIRFKSVETYLAMAQEEIDAISNHQEDLDEEVIKTARVISLNKPMVALTFDDGPYTRATIPILNTLKEHNVVGTFFVLGNRVSMHKEIVKRIVEEGNEIGNHTYSHIQLTSLTKDKVKEQLDKTQLAITNVTGVEPKIMRPTYGSYDEKLRASIDMPMILWSIDPKDWKIQDAQKIANSILSKVKDGDIILMHDMFVSTADAVDIIVPELLNRGFQLVTVSELYEYKGEVLSVGNIYRHKYNN